MSAAVGDIAGSAYEGRTHRTKDYAAVKLFSSRAKFTDDTVLTFACAEAFLDGKDMAWNLWKCAHEHLTAGYGHQFKAWLSSHDMEPYGSFGNGSAMRCSSAGGGDADTLAAIAGPMAYAFYREMPDSLVYAALKKLPDWMISVNERFDKRITEIHAE